MNVSLRSQRKRRFYLCMGTTIICNAAELLRWLSTGAFYWWKEMDDKLLNCFFKTAKQKILNRMEGSSVIFNDTPYFSKVISQSFLQLTFWILLNVQTTAFSGTIFWKSIDGHKSIWINRLCCKRYILFSLILCCKKMKCCSVVPPHRISVKVYIR